jgi:hypothetical protein
MLIDAAAGRRPRWIGVIAALLVLFPAIGASQDVMTIGSSEEPLNPGELIVVPVYVRDTGGTALDADAGTDRKIQDLSITVEYSPAAAVAAIDINRAGITSGLITDFETDYGLGNRQSLIVAFSESTAPLPFSLDSQLPGDLVAEVSILLRTEAGPNPYLRLNLVTTTSALGNSTGTIAETESNRQLILVSGSYGQLEIFSDGFESGFTDSWDLEIP